jgi:hypothetical protein
VKTNKPIKPPAQRCGTCKHCGPPDHLKNCVCYCFTTPEWMTLVRMIPKCFVLSRMNVRLLSDMNCGFWEAKK